MVKDDMRRDSGAADALETSANLRKKLDELEAYERELERGWDAVEESANAARAWNLSCRDMVPRTRADAVRFDEIEQDDRRIWAAATRDFDEERVRLSRDLRETELAWERARRDERSNGETGRQEVGKRPA